MNTHDKINRLIDKLEAIPAMDFAARAKGFHDLRDAIEPYAKRIAELESQLEAIGAGGVTQGQRLIEADRKRRGEPVAWYLPSADGYDSMFRDHATVKSCTGNPWDGWLPLYTAPAAPQPAVPAQVQHVDDINVADIPAASAGGELVAWVKQDVVEKQFINMRPRRIWWECNDGIGMPIYAAPQPAEPSIKKQINDEWAEKLRTRSEAPNASRWDELPVTREENEAWDEMEKRQ